MCDVYSIHTLVWYDWIRGKKTFVFGILDVRVDDDLGGHLSFAPALIQR